MKFIIKQNLNVKSFNKHWQFSVGADHASQALRVDFIRQLKYVHDQLGMRYVRFHGIFNDDMHTITTMKDIMPFKGGERFKEINFNKCGLVYDNILEIGMKPFVELSFMPSALASKAQDGLGFYGSNFSTPRDYNEWAEYIKDFIRYLLHRYGTEEIESWYFEVWNEPDLQGAFFSGSQQDYFKLYETTARAIKEIHPKLRVGGPSTSGSKWVKAFVRFCKINEVPVDFITTHQYAGDPLTGVEDKGGPEEDIKVNLSEGASNQEEEGATEEIRAMKAMMDKDIYADLPDGTCLDAMRCFIFDKSEMEYMPNDTYRKNCAIVKQQAEGLPLYYTEWNCSAMLTAYTNDTRKVAAYDVKASLDIEENLTGSSIWCFSDIFEEMHQFPQEFHGGFGLLTQSGIPKPVFYALKMLAQAGDERIDLGDEATDGEIGIAAFRSPLETQVLLFRQKMKHSMLPKETADVIVEVQSAPKKVIMERIDEEHCNPLKIWESQGCLADVTPLEADEIIRQSAMIKEELSYIYEDGAVHFSVELGVNDVYFIHIVSAN